MVSFRKAAYPSIRIPSSSKNESINHVKRSQRLVIGQNVASTSNNYLKEEKLKFRKLDILNTWKLLIWIKYCIKKKKKDTCTPVILDVIFLKRLPLNFNWMWHLVFDQQTYNVYALIVFDRFWVYNQWTN